MPMDEGQLVTSTCSFQMPRPAWNRDRFEFILLYSLFAWSLLMLWFQLDFVVSGILAVIRFMHSSADSCTPVIQGFGNFFDKGRIRVQFMQRHVGISVQDPLPGLPKPDRMSHRACICQVTPLSFAIRFCLVFLMFCGSSEHRSFSHLHAQRVGEALHPGPDPKFCTVAISNPTSIVSKPSVYSELIKDYDIDIVTAAETAATKKAQSLFSANARAWGYRTVWSIPAPEKTVRSDGLPSLRGQATGVAAFSHFPIRELAGTFPADQQATARLLHCFINCHGFELQLVVLYGLATAGSTNATRALMQAACKAVLQFPIPYMILGDFNSNPWNLGMSEQLQSLGLADLPMLHVDIHGTQMPPTCRQVTRPDNALICPALQPCLRQIQVLPDQHFDTHQVVLLRFDFQTVMQQQTRMHMPAPWSDLAISYEFVEQGYQHAIHSHGTPCTITEWGQTVEHAVDFAFRATQCQEHQISWNRTKPIAKRYRGRCQPRWPTCKPPTLFTKVGRPGDFHPGEVCRRRTRDLVKQVRRLRCLFNRLLKFAGEVMAPADFQVALAEWHCILRSKCMTTHFVEWCQSVPELGPPTFNLPDLDYLHMTLQLVQHVASDAQAFDLKLLSKIRKMHHHLDARWGGHSKAYMKMRDGFIAPFDKLVQPEQREVIVVPADDGTCQVWCDDADHFTSTQLVQLDDIPCAILSKTSYGLCLKPVDSQADLSQCTTLQQDVEIIDPRAICTKLHDFWAPFWEQDAIGVDAPEAFSDFLQQIRTTLPGPVVRVDDVDLWMNAIRSMKATSARGVDAIAASEMKQLPQCAIHDIMTIMNSYEDGYPAWFMVAITAPVPKTADTPQVSQIRPITVLAQLYRIWSRVICRQVLQHLSRYMPCELTGLLIGRGALDSAMRQQFLIERAASQGLDLSGLCLDLIKCYNTVHRARVKSILQALGLPEFVIHVWYQSLQRLRRLWIVQGTCGDLTTTVNGIPEGDSFSVVCMIALDFLWVTMVRARSVDSFLSAYADNISWAASHHDDHAWIIDQTVQFCDGFGMSIDWAKTWCWGTTTPALEAITAALRERLPHTQVDHRRNSLDLGAQMTYQGPPQLGKARARLDKAKARLHRLSSVEAPLHSKCLLALGGAMPVAFYGVALLPVGQQHVDTLRSAMATGLLGPSQSHNSALALLATPGCLDPMEFAILQVIRCARRFYFHLSEDEQRCFVDMAARHDGWAQHCKGPAGTLKCWLARLGWSIDRLGFVHIQVGIQIHLVHSSFASLAKWVRRAWQVEVLAQHCSRSALKHLDFDFASTRQIISKFPRKQHAALVQELSGAFQTERQKQTWAKDSTGLCAHCGQEDSRTHRLLHCPATQDIRNEHADVVRYLEEEGSIMAEFPAISLHPDETLLLAMHQMHPEADIAPAVLGRILTLVGQGLWPEIYTDGSLQHSNATVGKFASYGLVWDTCVMHSQRIEVAKQWIRFQTRPTNFVNLAFARTTGEQTIHRSELYAIVRTCELLPRAHIYSDSASALAVAARCQDARHLSALVNLQDFDLVRRLWLAMQQGEYTFTKVPSHVKPETCATLLESFRAWGNTFADELAITTCCHLFPQVVQLANQVHDEVSKDAEILTQVCQLHLKMHTARAKLDQANQQHPSHANVQPARALAPITVLQQWSVPQPWISQPNGLSQLSVCCWGLSLTSLLVRWMGDCVWPIDGLAQPDDPGITWHELFVSWVHFSGFLMPVRRSSGSDEYLQPIDTAVDVELYQTTFGEQVSTFLVCVTQVGKLLGYDLWPPNCKGNAKSLYRLGSCQHHGGFTVRPVIPHQRQVVDIMSRYVRTHERFDTMPDLPFHALPADMRHDLAGPWKPKYRRVTTGIAAVKVARREGNNSLQRFFRPAVDR